MEEEVASKLEALNATADALKGDGSDSVDAMLVKPLQTFMEAMTDFIASRGSHGFYSPPEDGVVHLPEMGQVRARHGRRTILQASDPVPRG